MYATLPYIIWTHCKSVALASRTPKIFVGLPRCFCSLYETKYGVGFYSIITSYKIQILQ